MMVYERRRPQRSPGCASKSARGPLCPTGRPFRLAQPRRRVRRKMSRLQGRSGPRSLPRTIPMLPLYAKDAVLWGTLSPTIRSDAAAVKAYFVGAFQALPKATVKFGDQVIRVYGNTAVNSGYYTFSYTKDGETKSIPARYSFTYVKDGNDWKIVDHHSTAVPAPPR